MLTKYNHIEGKKLIIFQNKLLEWFKKSGREFPWRKTEDPFKILVAEKLLQQTPARQHLVEAYITLTHKYPDPLTLSKANVNDLETILKPLGLFYRAKELKSIAIQIMHNYNGMVPKNINNLLDLNGIGQYCANAILCFAYNENIPVVDTNIARFLYRIFKIKHPFPSNPARNKMLYELSKSILPQNHCKDYNYAILDLCAIICRKKKPLCDECPVESDFLTNFIFGSHNV